MSSITKETEVFIEVCEKRYFDVAKILIESDKVNPSALDNKALNSAVLHNYTDIVELLLQHPKVILKKSASRAILESIVERGNGYHILSSILKSDKFDITHDDNNAIRRTAYNGYLDMFKLLLDDSRTDPAAMNNYCLRWSVTNNHLEIAKLLMQNKRVSIDSSIKHMENYPQGNVGNLTKLKKFRDEMTPEAGKLRTAIEGLKTMRDNLDKLIAELTK